MIRGIQGYVGYEGYKDTWPTMICGYRGYNNMWDIHGMIRGVRGYKGYKDTGDMAVTSEPIRKNLMLTKPSAMGIAVAHT